MKRYLITGVSGFVAFHFLDYLNSINQDCYVLGVDIDLPDIKNFNFLTHVKLELKKIDLLDYELFENILVSFSPTHIIHFASFSSVAKSWHEPINSFINNTNIFLNLIEIIRKNNIKCRLLSIGSSEEYGIVPSELIPIKESTPLNPISPYAVARVSQEMLSQCYVSSYNLDIILTRSFNHIGPRQKDIFVIPSFIKQILENMKKDLSNSTIDLFTGDISLIRDFTDVRDVVCAYYLLLEEGVSGELYNICSGVGISIKEIIDMLSELLKVNINIITDSNKIRPNDNPVIIGDNTKIVNHTGWKPQISLINSLQDIIIYWRNILNKGQIT